MSLVDDFAFPSSTELRSWAASAFGDQLDEESGRRFARRVERRGRWFTLSALLPSTLGLVAVLVLQPVLRDLSDAQFWVLCATAAAAVMIATTQWREILGWFQPEVAVAYYASTCVDRLRPRGGEDGTASDDDLRYLALLLPDLERQLLSARLTLRAAGSARARAVVRESQQTLAEDIGVAESRWRTSPGRTEAAALRAAIGRALVVVDAAGWFRLQPMTGVRPDEREPAPDPRPLHLTWLPALAQKLVSKGTELAVGTLGSVLLLLLSSAQRSG